jgi:hypothetical protein
MIVLKCKLCGEEWFDADNPAISYDGSIAHMDCVDEHARLVSEAKIEKEFSEIPEHIRDMLTDEDFDLIRRHDWALVYSTEDYEYSVLGYDTEARVISELEECGYGTCDDSGYSLDIVIYKKRSIPFTIETKRSVTLDTTGFTVKKQEQSQKEKEKIIQHLNDFRKSIGLESGQLLNTSAGCIDIFRVEDDIVTYGFVGGGGIHTETVEGFKARFKKKEK